MHPASEGCLSDGRAAGGPRGAGGRGTRPPAPFRRPPALPGRAAPSGQSSAAWSRPPVRREPTARRLQTLRTRRFPSRPPRAHLQTLRTRRFPSRPPRAHLHTPRTRRFPSRHRCSGAWNSCISRAAQLAEDGQRRRVHMGYSDMQHKRSMAQRPAYRGIAENPRRCIFTDLHIHPGYIINLFM